MSSKQPSERLQGPDWERTLPRGICDPEVGSLRDQCQEQDGDGEKGQCKLERGKDRWIECLNCLLVPGLGNQVHEQGVGVNVNSPNLRPWVFLPMVPLKTVGIQVLLLDVLTDRVDKGKGSTSLVTSWRQNSLPLQSPLAPQEAKGLAAAEQARPWAGVSGRLCSFPRASRLLT